MNSNDSNLLTDARVQHIAGSGTSPFDSPEAVVEFAETLAASNGDTVDEELTIGDEMVTEAEADQDDDDAESDDDDLDNADEAELIEELLNGDE